MPITLEEMIKAGWAAAPKIEPIDAMKLLAKGEAIALDVREEVELAKTGKVIGAINIPRARLEFKADPASPNYEPKLSREKTILLYCNSGARAALAGKTLKDMGFANVRLLGSFEDWVNAGGAVER
jgi:rhodanese-related sulfurtransferase